MKWYLVTNSDQREQYLRVLENKIAPGVNIVDIPIIDSSVNNIISLINKITNCHRNDDELVIITIDINFKSFSNRTFSGVNYISYEGDVSSKSDTFELINYLLTMYKNIEKFWFFVIGQDGVCLPTYAQNEVVQHNRGYEDNVELPPVLIKELYNKSILYENFCISINNEVQSTIDKNIQVRNINYITIRADAFKPNKIAMIKWKSGEVCYKPITKFWEKDGVTRSEHSVILLLNKVKNVVDSKYKSANLFNQVASEDSGMDSVQSLESDDSIKTVKFNYHSRSSLTVQENLWKTVSTPSHLNSTLKLEYFCPQLYQQKVQEPNRLETCSSQSSLDLSMSRPGSSGVRSRSISIESNALPSPIAKFNVETLNQSIDSFNKNKSLSKRKSIEHILVDESVDSDVSENNSCITKKLKSNLTNDPLRIEQKKSKHKPITHIKSPVLVSKVNIVESPISSKISKNKSVESVISNSPIVLSLENKNNFSDSIVASSPVSQNKDISLKDFRIPKLVLNKIIIEKTVIKFFGDSTVAPIFNAFVCKRNFSKESRAYVSENFEFIKNRMWEELCVDQLAKDTKFIYICSAGQCNWTERIGNKNYDININYDLHKDIVSHINETEKFIEAIEVASARMIWLVPMVMDFKRFNGIKEKYDSYDLKNTKECIFFDKSVQLNKFNIEMDKALKNLNVNYFNLQNLNKEMKQFSLEIENIKNSKQDDVVFPNFKYTRDGLHMNPNGANVAVTHLYKMIPM